MKEETHILCGAGDNVESVVRWFDIHPLQHKELYFPVIAVKLDILLLNKTEHVQKLKDVIISV